MAAVAAHIWSSKSLNAFELSDLYEWLDSIPLSKRRGQIEKDFADGQLAAEVVAHYFPHLVDLKSYMPCQNVQDRMSQWKALNLKLFRKIGLNVPSHTMTQLSIAKNGVAQIFLNNLRACIALSGARPVSQPPPEMTPRAVIQSPIYPDPMWYKYNLRYNLLNQAPPPLEAIYPNEFEFYWQKKQADRFNRSQDAKVGPASDPVTAATKQQQRQKMLGLGTLFDTNSYNNNMNMNTAKYMTPSSSNRYLLPPLQPVDQAAFSNLPIVSNNFATYTAYDPKTKQYINAPAEIQDLKNQLRRMEVLLQSKNSRIQELMSQIEKDKQISKRKYNTFNEHSNNNNNNKNFNNNINNNNMMRNINGNNYFY